MVYKELSLIWLLVQRFNSEAPPPVTSNRTQCYRLEVKRRKEEREGERDLAMGKLHGAAGVFFALSWFLFADGLIFARDDGVPYVFLMWLPGILCMVSLVLILLVNPDKIAGSGDDYFSTGFSDAEEQKAKILFFLASFVAVSGISIAIWKMSDTYNTAGATYPGVALLLQCVSMIIAMALLFKAGKGPSDAFGFS